MFMRSCITFASAMVVSAVESYRHGHQRGCDDDDSDDAACDAFLARMAQKQCWKDSRAQDDFRKASNTLESLKAIEKAQKSKSYNHSRHSEPQQRGRSQHESYSNHGSTRGCGRKKSNSRHFEHSNTVDNGYSKQHARGIQDEQCVAFVNRMANKKNTITIKAKNGPPANKDFGIDADSRLKLTKVHTPGWASVNTNLENYIGWRFIAIKVNGQSYGVKNIRQFNEVVDDTQMGDFVGFILEKRAQKTESESKSKERSKNKSQQSRSKHRKQRISDSGSSSTGCSTDDDYKTSKPPSKNRQGSNTENSQQEYRSTSVNGKASSKSTTHSHNARSKPGSRTPPMCYSDSSDSDTDPALVVLPSRQSRGPGNKNIGKFLPAYNQFEQLQGQYLTSYGHSVSIVKVRDDLVFRVPTGKRLPPMSLVINNKDGCYNMVQQEGPQITRWRPQFRQEDTLMWYDVNGVKKPRKWARRPRARQDDDIKSGRCRARSCSRR